MTMVDVVSESAVPDNLFSPEFGRVPAIMAGRSAVIEEVLDAFRERVGNPNLCTLLVGARGMGKTALLSYLGNEAQKMGWVAAEVTCGPGMLEDILQRARESASHLLEASSKRKITSLEVHPLGAVGWENAEQPLNWRSEMNMLLDDLAASGTGLVITVDEADAASEELTHLIVTYQHFVREGREVSLIIAGLPFNIEAILSGKSTSFLRRAARYDLSLLPAYEVEEAFRLTVEEGGRHIDPEALEDAVGRIGGFPYMLQLLGYRAWRAAGSRNIIERADVENGAKIAQGELDYRVFGATFNELSKGDVRFLEAMLEDEGSTARADVAKRLGKKSGFVSTYKKRLLAAGVIEEPQSGQFVFALPGFRDYLTRRLG